MAVRRSILEQFGGMRALGAHLGDDYILGSLTAAGGASVEIVPHTVACIVDETSLSANFNHLLRWARTIRKQRPLGYGFMFVTLPLPFAAIALAFSHAAPAAIALLAVTTLARFALHAVSRHTSPFRERNVAWLVPFADSLELAVWVTAFFGNAVRWRTQEYSVGNHGRVR
jgi:ceramide glucosyltransferase